MQPHPIQVRRQLKKYEPEMRRQSITKRRLPPRGSNEAIVGVPELDPNGARAGLLMLLGSVAIIADRRRRADT